MNKIQSYVLSWKFGSTKNPFSPEYDKLGFGRIEIFTKPGSDKFRSSVGYVVAYWRQPSWDLPILKFVLFCVESPLPHKPVRICLRRSGLHTPR